LPRKNSSSLTELPSGQYAASSTLSTNDTSPKDDVKDTTPSVTSTMTTTTTASSHAPTQMTDITTTTETAAPATTLLPLEPYNDKSPTWAIVLVSILICFAGIFTVFALLRRYFIRYGLPVMYYVYNLLN